MTTRKRISQVCAAAAAAAMFLTWHTTTSEGLTKAVQGTASSEGQLVLVAGLVTVGLIQVGWRPAWIAAGLMVAVTTRAMLDSGSESGAGLLIAAAASVVAMALLVWDMFANVSASGDGSDSDADGRGLSGPLGRRRH